MTTTRLPFITRIIGISLFITAFIFYNYLIDINERLFDIAWLLGLGCYLVTYTDYISKILFSFVCARLYAELSNDNGIVNIDDLLEFLIILIIVFYRKIKLTKWKVLQKY